MNIVLTGFMATGKTKISKALSELTGYKLVDTDEMITEREGKTINEIFEEIGEEGFRKKEHEVICEAAKLDGYIISTGGGVPLNRENMKELRKNGIIVNLSPSFDVIKERLEKARESRPLLKNSELADIEKRFNDRKPFYADCDYSVSVNNEKQPQDFAQTIIDMCKLL